MKSDCIFCKIVAGQLPSCKVYEDAETLAFMDIGPIVPGHTLVIPKQEIDYIFDIEDELLGGLMMFAKKVAKAIKKATMRTRGYYSEPGMADRCVLIWEQEGFRARWVEETETESPYRYRIETWESF